MLETKPRPIIVISAEGLTPAALSCYGSSWNETPAIDALATEGCVWDRVIASSTSPSDVLMSWWNDTSFESVISTCKKLGSIDLVTDDERVIDAAKTSGFESVEWIKERRLFSKSTAGTSIENTRLGRLFAAAIDRLSQEAAPALLWIHSSSLTQVWDAPRFLALVDEEVDEIEPPSEDVELLDDGSATPEPIEAIPLVFPSTEVPVVEANAESHPDFISSWMRTYGCQVRLLDFLVGMLTDMDALANAQWVIAGTSGFALGQNGWIAPQTRPVRTSQLRLPLVISRPPALRVPQLISTVALPRLLQKLTQPDLPLVDPSEWIEDDQEFEPAIRTHDPAGAVILTTPKWLYVNEADSPVSLFLKPDDMDDVNDIARLRPDVADQIAASLAGP